MDKKQILEDGLLEQYLLGELPNDQEILIQNVLAKDDDLKNIFNEIEEEFERIAFENAINPPEKAKKALIRELESSKENIKIRNINVPQKRNTLYSGRLAVAASMAAIFALSSFWLYNRWQASEQNLNGLQEQTIALQERLMILEQNIEVSTQRYKTINNRNVIPLLLKGNQTLPESRAVAYVNHETKSVLVNSQGLPPLEEDKTYQMWADVDGVMINMGLLPADSDLIPVKYIDKAESFNITIEPAGGNDHPTVENLISNVLL
ncbi:anti-sigma factor [uncultured Eudoraea sp.]|uniref:anti-sigma factor n=1 Tax=uncultured Eudoraea sp. TaxID=1035614 RepID=UPI002621675E|nr:anti-sigma factor [uncultured Eudoraea sp.]